MCYISTGSDCSMLFLFLPHEKVLWGSIFSLPMGTSESSTDPWKEHAGWALHKALSQEGRREAALAGAPYATAPVRKEGAFL